MKPIRSEVVGYYILKLFAPLVLCAEIFGTGIDAGQGQEGQSMYFLLYTVGVVALGFIEKDAD